MRLYHLKFRAIERGLHECAIVRPGKTLLLRSASEDIMPQTLVGRLFSQRGNLGEPGGCIRGGGGLLGPRRQVESEVTAPQSPMKCATVNQAGKV